jgi:hypothetical protein
VAQRVLTVIFQHEPELVAQEGHLGHGAFFVPAPDPSPEPLEELLLRIESSNDQFVELPVRVVQISPTHIALAPADAKAARASLAPLIEAVRSNPGDGATWVFWGATDSSAQPVAPEPAPSEPAPPPEPAVQPDDKLLYDQIREMSSNEKMQLALKGDRNARLLLLKDVNKGVQPFLLQNPRITIDEIRYIAGYRQANPDVLVTIAGHRDWGQNQGVLAALVRNPKTPAPTAVKLLDKIAPGELRRLAKSGEVPRAVQTAARKKVTD